jgi:hypothetical protein
MSEEKKTMDEQRPVCSKCGTKLVLVMFRHKDHEGLGWKHECECVEDLFLEPDYIVRI